MPDPSRGATGRDAPSQRAALAGIGALVAIAIVAVLALGEGEDPPPDVGTIERADADDPSVGEPRVYLGAIPIQGTPVGLDVHDHEVSVATRLGGELVTIDEGDRKRSGAAVELEGEGEDVVTKGGFAWVTLPNDDLVAKVSLDDATVVDTIPVGDEPRGIVASGDALWTANLSSSSLTRIDPASGATETTALGGAEPTDVAFDAGKLWVSDGAGFVISVDATGWERFEVGADPKGVVVDGDVWVANGDGGSVTRLSASGEFEEEVQVGGIPRGVTSGFGRIWVANGGEGGGYVTAIDPGDTSDPVDVEVEGSPEGIAAGPERLWVTTGSSDSLVSISPGEAP